MAKKSSISSDAVKGTWEYNGSYSTQKVTSGKTPYKTYFSVVKGILSNTDNTALVTVYADSNKNGNFDSTDLLVGDATTKTYVAGTSGTKGTFVGSLKSNVTYSYVGNKRVGEATFHNSAWSPAQASNMLAGKSSKKAKQPKGNVDKLTGIWERQSGLTQPLDSNNTTIDIVRYYSKDPLTGKTSGAFAVIFDNPGGVTGQTYQTQWDGSTWSYKDDYIAIYKDTNDSGKLEASDTFLGSFNTGGDFGGLQGNHSSGTFYLDKKNMLSQYDQLGHLISTTNLPISIA